MKQRIDKIFSSYSILSRKECEIAVKKKLIKVNGEIVKNPSLKADVDIDEITLNDVVQTFKKFVYIMLNKPNGVVSATEDTQHKTVIDILPDNMKRKGLFPCGRLDKDTVGLVILTDDGVSAHKKLSPKSQTEKVYYYKTADEVLDTDITKIEQGVMLKDGYLTKPCKVNRISKTEGEIILTEGKYHEIKRIFGSLNNKIIYLKRLSFGGIKLDDNLKEGTARYLTDSEENLFIN